MRALVRKGADVLLEADHPDPSPSAGEVLLRPLLVGVTAADVAAARGEPAEIDFQGVLGHQFVGVVEAARSERHASLVGQRVVADPFVVDPTSELARRGLARHEPERALIGLKGRNGCLSERIALPAANIAVVPESVPDDAAVLAVPVAAAVHASRIVRLEGKTFVTVLGDSLEALLCAQVMAKLNHTVRLLSRREDRLAIAERWGVKRRPIDEVGLRNDQDVVIDCTGEPEMVSRAFAMVRPRGTVVLKREPVPLPGAKHDGSGPDLTPLILNELDVIGASFGRVAEAAAELAGGDLDLTGLVTKRVRFDQATGALRAAADEDQVRVVVEMS
ncbi:MAG: alcohol dehydrogenase catalytic domain-containing protein [Planctomycetota bacterium]